MTALERSNGRETAGGAMAPDGARLDDAAMQAFGADAKVALLATVDPDGRPHVTLITSIHARTPTELMFGQFCEGRSKDNVRREPRVGVLVMTRDLRMWRCTARWTGETQHGEDYELYNKKPMFRYNAYVGIHTIHYFDLVTVSPGEQTSRAELVRGALKAWCARPFLRPTGNGRILSPWAVRLLGQATTLTFVAFVGSDGYPRIVPLVPCPPVGSAQVAVFPGRRHVEMADLRPGTMLACYGLNLGMESVLVSGQVAELRRVAGMRVAVIDIDQIYNSMPPQHGVVYPPQPLEPAQFPR